MVTRIRLLLVASFALAALWFGMPGFTGATYSTTTPSTGTVTASTDWTPPTVTMTNPGTPVSGTITVTATASDAQTGIANVVLQYSVTGSGTWTTLCTAVAAPYQCSWNTKLVAGGPYTLRAIATDNAAYSTTSATVSTTVNNSATVVLTNPGSPLKGGAALSATASNYGNQTLTSLHIDYSAAGQNVWTTPAGCTGATASLSCNLPAAGLNGSYDLRAVAVVAGTTYTHVISNIVVDSTSPTVSVVNPGATIRGSVTVTATATDTGGSGVAQVLFQYDPPGAVSWTAMCAADTVSPFTCAVDTTTLVDGSYVFRAIATDAAGNATTSSTVTSTIDNTSPVVTLADPGTPLSGSVTMTATATDTGGSGVAQVLFQYDPPGATSWTAMCAADTVSPFTCTVNTATLPDGSYDFRAIATDVAGNATTSATRTSTLTNSSVAVTSPGSYVSGTLTVGATATSGMGVKNVALQYAVQGSGTYTTICTDLTSPYTCSWNTSALNGAYNLRAVMTDNTNATLTSALVPLTVDNVALAGSGIQTVNAGATAGLVESGDKIVYTYNDVVNPTTVLSGWDGTSTSVSVGFDDAASWAAGLDGWTVTGTNLGTVLASQNMVKPNKTFALTGTMVTTTTTVSGNTATVVTVTLTQTPPANAVLTEAATGTLSWTPSSVVANYVAAACATTTVTQAGTGGKDF